MPPSSPIEHEQLSANEPQKALPAHASPDADGGKPRSSWLRTLIICLIVVLAVGYAVWQIHRNTQETAATNARTAAAADRPVPVQAAPAVQKTMPIYLTALGSVTAYNTVTIKTRVDGQLLRVNFREGQSVKEGDLLLQIDPRPYQAAVDQAIGQLAKDQANLNNMAAEAQRYTQLYDAGVVSKESQQAQVSNQGQAAGSIKADEAAIEAAKVNLAYTRITSPINGVVGLRQVDPGNIVHAADTTGLIVITQIQPIAVIFTLPEDQLPQVVQLYRSGKKLVAEAYDRSNATKLASGTLLTYDNQIDQTTGTVKLKAVFQNENDSLFPNQFVNIRLILTEQQNAVVIPAAAIQTGTQGSSFVYLVHPGQPPANQQTGADGNVPAPANGGSGRSRRSGSGAGGNTGPANAQRGPSYYVETQPVKINVTEGAEVIIASGINPGDQVVIDGQEKLRNGSRITLSHPAAASQGTGTNGGLNSGVNDAGSTAAATPAGRPASGNATPDVNSTLNGNHPHQHRNGQNSQSGQGGQGPTQ